MQRSYLLKFLVSVLLVSTKSLFAEAPPIANDTTKRIVILGDSLTAGYGLDPSQAYPALLQQKITTAKLPLTITNAGVSGDTTAGGLRRVNWALSQGADFLIIALGGNDGLRGIPPAETKKNLLGIIAKARSKNPAITILIAGMEMPDNMGPRFTKRFKSLFSEVSQESKTTLIPFLLKNVGGIEALNQTDGIHPNPKGQAQVAENVWKILLPLLTPASQSPAP